MEEKSNVADKPKLTFRDMLSTAILIAILIGAIFFAFNTIINYFDKTTLLLTPCQLCLDKNPQLGSCFNNPPFQMNKLIDFDNATNIATITNVT